MFQEEDEFKVVSLKEYAPIEDNRFVTNLDGGLPKTNKKTTISLDLDNTLIHAENSKMTFRPYAIQFLKGIEELKKKYSIEIIAWTASKINHCSPVVQAIEQETGTKFDFILHCHDSVNQHDGKFFKDQLVLGRDEIIHVDDNPYICRHISHVTYFVPPFESKEFDTNLIYCYYDIERHVGTGRKGKVAKYLPLF